MRGVVMVSISLSMGLCLGIHPVYAGGSRYLEFPHTLPGKILKLSKEFDQATGKFKLVSNVPDVQTVADLLALEAEERSARKLEMGNLDENLSKKLAHLGVSDWVKVGIKIKTYPHTFLDKTRHSKEELEENSRAMLARPPLVSPSILLQRHGLSGAEMRGENIIVLEAGRSVLDAMKHDADIAAIWEERAPALLAPSLTTLASSGYNPGGVPSGAGSGVKVATFEYGITSSFLSCIGVTPTAWDTFPALGSPSNKRHSQAVFRTLVASAPGATFYHRHSTYYNGTNDINYIVNNGIQVTSMSLDRGGTSPHRATYSEFLSMDNMAFASPFPVFVTPTANSGYSYEANWQCYNCINVGNVRHTNETTYEMAECTQTKNPPPRYGGCISGSGENCAGDREMPLVVAPGIPSTGTTFDATCIEGEESLTCGTSWSAPVVNGMVADMISADSRMVGWPEKVRAGIVLTAQNVESGDWTVSGDERDGTGTVSGSAAVSWAPNYTHVNVNNSAVESGMKADSYYAADFSAAKRFNYLVPNPKPSGKHLRVVLTWTSNPIVNSGTNDLSDLDLVVQKNGGTATSSSWDSNVEVVDIAAADVTAGSSYYIDLSPYANRIPSSGPNYLYYAIAWGWVKDHAP